jgi:hypothetical protein
VLAKLRAAWTSRKFGAITQPAVSDCEASAQARNSALCQLPAVGDTETDRIAEGHA